MGFVKFCVSAAILALLMFSAATVLSAADAPTNEDLYNEIVKLKAVVEQQGETIKQQNERIRELESKAATGVCGAVEEAQPPCLPVAKRESIPAKALGLFEGLRICAGATFVGQGTPNANAAGSDGIGRTEDSRFDASYKVKIDVSKAFGDYAMALIKLEASDGDTLDGDLALYPECGVNAASDRGGDQVAITQVWYEHYLFNDQLRLKGGKIDPTDYLDVNEFANCEDTQFLNDMFTNNPAVEFPDNSFGGRVQLAPRFLPAFELEGLYLATEADWDEVFDRPFAGVQLNFMPHKAFGFDEEQWCGNYRVFYWYNGEDHTELEDGSRTKEKNQGVGVSCDQRITDVFGVFGRFGWQYPEVSVIEYHWSAGAEMTGSYWKRDDDILAVAIGQVIPGDPYRDTSLDHLNQTHFEAYYSIHVNDHLKLSPDFQVIWDPDGSSEESPIYVYGIRGRIDL